MKTSALKRLLRKAGCYKKVEGGPFPINKEV